MTLVEMASRKHSRSHKRRSTRSHKKSHKRTHRRRQQGGAALAPFVAGDAYLLDAQTRVQAEVGPLDRAFGDLPSVIPRQAGGRRRSMRRHHKHKGSRKVCTRKHSRRSRSSRRSLSSRRYQRGGALAPFAGSYTLIDHHAMTPKMLAQNDQFVSEASVNGDYSQFAGAQH